MAGELITAVTASLSSWVQHHLLELHGPVVYLVVGALVFIEVGIVVGFFVPGEIATIIGGVVASQHHANVVLLVVVVAGAATLGNFSGYEIGKLVGPWLLSHRPLRGNAAVGRGRALLARRGGPAILVARWVAVVRAVMPGLAGMSDMARPPFMVFSFLGGALWGAMWVAIGYAAGLSYQKVVARAGKWSLLVLGVLAVGFVAFGVWRKVRERRLNSGSPSPPTS